MNPLALPRVLLTPLRAVVAIEQELRGMRGDLRAIVAELEGLRGDVRSLHDGVGRISDATLSLDTKVDQLKDDLEGVNTLAGRLGRFGARRREGEHT